MAVEAPFALALFLHARGFVPVRTAMRDGHAVYYFADEAQAHVLSFDAACSALSAYAQYAACEARDA